MAITSVATASTDLADFQAVSITTSNASNMSTVGHAKAYECRNLKALSPTDQAAMENIAQTFERYVRNSVEPLIRSAQ